MERNEPSRPRRVVVALDPEAQCRAALEAARGPEV